jgi:hypothetical protein
MSASIWNSVDYGKYGSWTILFITKLAITNLASRSLHITAEQHLIVRANWRKPKERDNSVINGFIKNQQYLNLFWQFLRYLVQRFNRDGCRQSAAALTYMSLFAIVPMLTLMYSMFSLIPAFQDTGSQVEAWIFSKVLPSRGQEITSYLSEFSAQARKVSSVGAVILMVTSYLMLAKIEKTFNHI